ncbi:MAG: thiamine pyrophosphate-requiring protein [Reyranellaceae bacterium]
MRPQATTATSTAEVYLAILRDRGVEYLFANAGTDFAPIVEGYAKASLSGTPTPTPITATHENLALSMAHGYAVVSGKLPAVMVHVSVGTANGVCAIMNAARENVAMLFTAGRTPLFEDDTLGSRDSYIHWGQEMFDQAGMVRELVKWDYELRSGVQVETVVDRAINIATTEPRGPVYLSLPREVLAAPMEPAAPKRRPVAALPSRPSEAGVAEAARLLAAAKNPLIIAGNTGRDTAAIDLLAELATRFALPVVQNRARHLALPSSHPMHLGYESGPHLGEADVVMVLECDVPWVPKTVRLKPECRVIHVGFDPLFGSIPIRGFPCDLALSGSATAFMRDLATALSPLVDAQAIEGRRGSVAKRRETMRARLAAELARAKSLRAIHPAWVSHCISEAKGDEAIVVNEYTLMAEHCRFERPGTYFGSSSASGLGWGMGAALGAKLAAPDKLVIATLGDGAYIFANPVAGHYAAHQNGLPILTIVFNNGMWNAVRRSTLTVYPEGLAAKSNSRVLSQLNDLPAFEQICAAAGGYGERVEDPADVPAALARAIKAVTQERRQALLNIICQPR